MLTGHEVCVTIEEGSIGGLGAHVLTLASDEGLIDAGLKLRTMRLPDMFQDQDSPQAQYDAAGLNAPPIVVTVLKAPRHNSAGVEAAGARAYGLPVQIEPTAQASKLWIELSSDARRVGHKCGRACRYRRR